MQTSDSQFAGIVEFVQVVDSGSFTDASLQLGVSKSHVSKRVTMLEERLNTRLFHRTTRALTLTEAGLRYYQRCIQTLCDLDEAAQDLAQDADIPRGILKLSAPVTLGEFFISSLLADFAVRHPSLQVDFNLSTRNVALLEEGYDLAIRIGHLEDSDYRAKKLAPVEFCVLASADYLEKYGVPESIEALDNHNCLTCSPHGPHAGATWKFTGENAFVAEEKKVKGSWSCNNCYGLICAARKGLGLVWLPEVLVQDDLANGNLRTVLDKWRLQSTIWAVYPAHKYLPAKVTQFLDFLADAFQHRSPWQHDLERSPYSAQNGPRLVK